MNPWSIRHRLSPRLASDVMMRYIAFLATSTSSAFRTTDGLTLHLRRARSIMSSNENRVCPTVPEVAMLPSRFHCCFLGDYSITSRKQFEGVVGISSLPAATTTPGGH